MMRTNRSNWICTKCTFLNEQNDDNDDDDDNNEIEKNRCKMCQEQRDISRSSSIYDEVDRRRPSIRLSELSLSLPRASISHGSKTGGGRGGESLTALNNLSFAAWESDRQSWRCNACTFDNEPRFLICGGCGMAEGGGSGSGIVDDELITAGLGHMSLTSAQQFLMGNIQEQLNTALETNLRQERIAELIEEQIRDERKQSESKVVEEMDSKAAKAWHDIHVLEKVQAAEKEEHCDMRFVLEQWREQLNDCPDEEQEGELKRQEEMLENLIKEWGEREENIQQMKIHLEGGVGE